MREASRPNGALTAHAVDVVAFLAGVTTAMVHERMRDNDAAASTSRLRARFELKKALMLFGLRVSHSQTFHGWESLPGTGLLPRRWLSQRGGAEWGWTVFFRGSAGVTLLQPQGAAVKKVKSSVLKPNPPWFIEIRNVSPTILQRFQT